VTLQRVAFARAGSARLYCSCQPVSDHRVSASIGYHNTSYGPPLYICNLTFV